jgi:hypothetical protein
MGLPRCGTTLLHSIISKSKFAFASKAKEIDYFSLHSNKSWDWYLDKFKASARETHPVLVDLSVNYSFSESAILRINKVDCPVKLFMCLRKPSELLNSLYYFAARRGLVYSLEDLLDIPIGYIVGPKPGNSDPYNSPLVRHVIDVENYFRSIQLKLDHPLHAIPLEYIQADPDLYLNLISNLTFNAISPFQSDLESKVNASSLPKFQLVSKLIPVITQRARNFGFLDPVIGFGKHSRLFNRIIYQSVSQSSLSISPSSGINLDRLDERYLNLASSGFTIK